MADTIFTNTADVKWTSDFDSFLIQSAVDGGSGVNASLTLGGSEILSANINVVSTIGPLLALGVVEVLASAEIATLSVPSAELTLGVDESMTATGIIESTTSSFMNFGGAEQLDTTNSSTTSVGAELSLGIVEVVSSTITTTSVTAGPLLTLGYSELMTSSASVQSDVNGLLDLGTLEILGSTSVNASTSDAWLQLGILEPMTASAHANIDETIEGNLELGAATPLTTGVVITTTNTSLLGLGIAEVLGSTDPISSTVTGTTIDFGVPEALAHTIDAVILGDPLTFGNDVTGSGTASVSATQDPERVASDLFSNITGGLDEAWSCPSQGGWAKYDFGDGNEKQIEQYTIQAPVDAATANFPITWVLYGSNNDSDWDTLDSKTGQATFASGEKRTYSFKNLTSYRYIRLSALSAGTDLNIDELEYMEAITREDSYSEPYSVASLSADITLGISETLSSTIALVIPVTSSITLGIVETTASTGAIVSTVLDSVLTLGAETPITASIDLETASSAFLYLGITEVLEASASPTISVDGVAILGEAELLSSVRATTSDVTATLILGVDEQLTHIINNPAFVTDEFTTALFNFRDGSLVDESGNDHDMVIGGTAYITSSYSLFEGYALAPSTGYGMLSNIDNASLDFSDEDYCIEFGAYLGGDFDPVTEGYYLFKQTKGSAYQRLSVVGYNATIMTVLLELNDGAGTSGNISFNIPKSALLNEWKYYTIFRINDNVYVRIDGKQESFTYSSSTHVVFADSGYLFDSTVVFGEIIEAGNNSIFIDAIRISIGTSRYTTADFDPYEYVAKDITGTATASLYLGESEILTATQEVVGNAVAELSLGAPTPLSGTINTVSSSNGIIILGITEVLTGTAPATIEGGTITGVLTLGLTELLASTIAYTSASAAGEIQVGNAEILACTTGAQVTTSVSTWSIDFGQDEVLSRTIIPTGYEGAWEDLYDSPQDYPIGSNAVGLLLIGVNEILSATAAITIEADILAPIFGQPEPMTATGGIVTSSTLSTLLLGIAEDLSSTQAIISTTSTSLLDLGVTEVLADVDNALTLSVDATLTLGVPETLGHTLYEFTSGPLDPYAVSTTVGLMILGVDEILGTVHVAQSVVDDAELTMGGPVPLESTVTITTTDTSDLLIGHTEVLTDECVSWTSISGQLTTGIVESTSSTIATHSVADAVLTLGISEPLSSSISFENTTTQDLTMGISEVVAATQGVISTTSNSLLTLGILEVVSSTVASNSVTDSDLILGITEELTSSITAQSSTSAFISFGVDEPLSATSTLGSVGTAQMNLGENEFVAASRSTQSVTYAQLILGIGETLSATSPLTTTSTTNLSFGIVETASVSTTFTSSSDADLTIGHVEPLSSTINPSTEHDASIILGGSEPLSASYLVQSNAEASTIIFGVSELVASTSITASTADASITLGVDEPLSATNGGQVSIDSFINLGVVEDLSATNGPVSYAIAEATMGIATGISHTRWSISAANTGDLFIDSESVIEDENGTHTITAHGGAAITSSKKYRGNSSTYLDGDGDYLSVPDSPDWDFGTGDYTIDLAVYKDTWIAQFLCARNASFSGDHTTRKWGIYINTNGTIYLFGSWPGGNSFLTTESLNAGEWNHIAIVRNSGTTKIYINGIGSSGFIDNQNHNYSDPIFIGGGQSGSIDGYIDNFRITKGSALWTSNFDVDSNTEMFYDSQTINSISAQSVTSQDLTIGVMEMMTSTSGPISTTSTSLLDLGISEVLGSAQIGQSNVAANLTLGLGEPLAHTALTAPSSPTYTADQTSEIGGAAFASHYEFGNEPALAFDDTAASEWIASYDADPFSPYILRWDFGDGNDVAIQKYILSFKQADYRPTKWTFEGSDDGATSWDILDTQSWTPDSTTKVVDIVNLNDYRYYRFVFTEGEDSINLRISEIAFKSWNEDYVHSLEVAQSIVPVSLLNLGIGEDLTSTINVTTTSDASITMGLVEVLATLGFGIAVTTSEITLGVDEPLSATAIAVENTTLGDLDIPGAAETCSAGVVITTEGDASTLDTGVIETASAFKMIWSQIHTPELTLGLYEYVAVTDGASVVSIVDGEPLIMGIIEVLATAIASHSVADASLSTGIGEYLEHDLWAPEPQDLCTNSANVSASSYEGAEGGSSDPRNAFDDIVNSKWGSDTNETLPQWIQYEFDSPTVITKYTVASDRNYNEYYAPEDWTFSGYSVATGWVVLDIVNNQQNWGEGQKRTFNISNTTQYDIYRIRVTDQHAGYISPVVVIGEIEMLDATVPAYTNSFASTSSNAFLSTGEDELLASTVITPSVTAGELVFGLIEVMSASRSITSMTIGQIYAGIEEILESTTANGNGASCEMVIAPLLGRTPCALKFNHEYANRGSLFTK